MEWIISDTHFHHHNIIRYCSRPFHGTWDMNAAMVTRWQGTVCPGDTVYHLGDFGYFVGKQATKSPDDVSLISSLPGRKILIRGNHDKNSGCYLLHGFDVVAEEMTIRRMGKVLRLIHKPQLTQPPGVDYTLHGHIHNTTPEYRKEFTHKGELVDIPPFNINMSVEMWNYTPVSLEWLIKKHLR